MQIQHTCTHSERSSIHFEQEQLQKKNKLDNQESKEEKRLVHFSAGQKMSTKFHDAKEKCVQENMMKGELICNSRENYLCIIPSLRK